MLLYFFMSEMYKSNDMANYFLLFSENGADCLFSLCMVNHFAWEINSIIKHAAQKFQLLMAA